MLRHALLALALSVPCTGCGRFIKLGGGSFLGGGRNAYAMTVSARGTPAGAAPALAGEAPSLARLAEQIASQGQDLVLVHDLDVLGPVDGAEDDPVAALVAALADLGAAFEVLAEDGPAGDASQVLLRRTGAAGDAASPRAGRFAAQGAGLAQGWLSVDVGPATERVRLVSLGRLADDAPTQQAQVVELLARELSDGVPAVVVGAGPEHAAARAQLLEAGFLPQQGARQAQEPEVLHRGAAAQPALELLPGSAGGLRLTFTAP